MEARFVPKHNIVQFLHNILCQSFFFVPRSQASGIVFGCSKAYRGVHGLPFSLNDFAGSPVLIFPIPQIFSERVFPAIFGVCSS